MPDQAQKSDAPLESVSPEVRDAFGEGDQSKDDSAEKVNSDGEETKEAVEDKTKENDSEGKPGEADKSKDEDAKDEADKPKDKDAKPTEDKKTPDTEKKDEEDDIKSKDKTKEKDDAQSDKFEVGGTEYDTFDKAVVAVNRINGDNSRLTGDNKQLKSDASEKDSQIKILNESLDKYKEANDKWNAYYSGDGDGEKPDTSKLDVEEVIDKKLKASEKDKADKALQDEYDVQLDKIFKEEDFEDVKPFFQELVNEYEGVPKATPKKLYKRAQLAYKESLGESQDDKDLDELAEEKAKKIILKKEVNKSKSESGGSAKDESDKDDDISPEVADAFHNRM